MLAERLCFAILMFLTTPPGTPPPNENSATRKKKCPGCQGNHGDHTFGHPSKNCQGPQSPSSSPLSRTPTTSPRSVSRAAAIQQRKQTSEENPGLPLSGHDEQMSQYRRHLQFLKRQENELLDSIRAEQENQEENNLRDEIKLQTEKLERLKASRSHSSRSAIPPFATQNAIPSGENRAQSNFLNDNMSTLLHRPLLASAPLASQHQPQQTQSQSHSAGHALGFAASLSSLNSGSNSQESHRPVTQNELFLRPTRTNDITREFASSLLAEVQLYREATYAVNTRKAYRTHRKVYLQFCNMLNISPAPVQRVHLCMYAAYLARFLLPQSVCVYLNFVGLLHREMGFPNPLLDNWFFIFIYLFFI
ncbi:uncharacterized protein [Clytia hemisphaerica]|uniref:uncharacterized protein n=1 Tax=Clytia hemisphaerica TaxID=252671 RepID=UPI0034D65BC5